jgi:hypothetical protein
MVRTDGRFLVPLLKELNINTARTARRLRPPLALSAGTTSGCQSYPGIPKRQFINQCPSPQGSPHAGVRISSLVPRRLFHSSSPRRDILFVSVPAFKAFLLSATRLTLVVLPFWWRQATFRGYLENLG